MIEDQRLYGLMAEFLTTDAILDASRRAYEAGYRRMEAYSPFPVDGLAEAIGYRRNRVAGFVLFGGISGGVLAYVTQWFSAVVHYPINVGGRPFHSWPSFIPITFELTILGASLAAVFGMLWMNGLPRPYHPVFNVPGFVLASRSRFFLCIQANDPKFDREATRLFLQELKPKEISEVEH